MNDTSLHRASAPNFIRQLNHLNAWFDKAEAHAKAKKFDVEVLLQARLAPDMFTLIGQVQLATAFAKNALCRLAGQEPPDFPAAEKTLADLRARIARTLAIVQAISPDQLQGAATRQVTVRTGPDTSMTMTGEDYLFNFSLPQFYFHVTMTYALLRHNGVDLGKRDFVGS